MSFDAAPHGSLQMTSRAYLPLVRILLNDSAGAETCCCSPFFVTSRRSATSEKTDPGVADRDSGLKEIIPVDVSPAFRISQSFASLPKYPSPDCSEYPYLFPLSSVTLPIGVGKNFQKSAIPSEFTALRHNARPCPVRLKLENLNAARISALVRTSNDVSSISSRLL
jgi:hypothetical protein